MSKKVRNRFFVSVFIMVLATVVFSVTRPPPPSPPLPNPNGYDDFLNASRLINGDIYKATTMDHDGFHNFLLTNAEPLRLIRLGLTRRCVVPTEAALKSNLNVLADFKRLGLLIAAEGKFAEQENRNNDALECYLTDIRFGDEMSRGGPLIHRLVGLACESLGYDPLVKLAPKLTCDQTRSIIAELEKMERDGVTWDEVAQGEKRYFKNELRHTINPIWWVTGWWQSRPARIMSEAKHNRTNARLRLLTVELALRCYQSEQGRVPKRLEELVPKYIQHVPEDPFSHQPLHYRAVAGTNWVLYSVGLDGIDDGGVPVKHTVSGTIQQGDLFYDSPY
ncbi:MAG: hypothetical protein JWQ04_452 [Pedosphaera sp.]|nr:hypothetical protein [Pedosphaera sp.]